MHFEHVFISDSSYETRSKLRCLMKISTILNGCNYRKIVYPGWEVKELFFLSLLTSKKSNCVAVESSILETKKTGIVWWVKKIFLKRMSTGLPSGDLQAEIFRLMGFKGQLVYTNGVGVLNESFYKKSKHQSKEINSSLNYLYVGRISEEKNLKLLCEVFSSSARRLTIVGYGPQEEELMEKYHKDIVFLGEKNNDELKKIYEEHQVFILPSKSEPWGLVVEEALCSGLPVVVSDMVGSKNELVTNKSTGVIFKYDDKKSLLTALEKIEQNYVFYKHSVNQIDVQALLYEKITPYFKLTKGEI
ncbi:glycosyltransferase family 4 protein [Pseudocitrobacter faecalis]